MELTERHKELLRHPPSTVNGWDSDIGYIVGELIAAGLLEAKTREVTMTIIDVRKTDAGRAALGDE